MNMSIATSADAFKEWTFIFLTMVLPQSEKRPLKYSILPCPKQMGGFSAYQAYDASSTSSSSFSTRGKCTCASAFDGLLFYCNGVTRQQFERSIGVVHPPAVHAIIAHNSNLAGLSPHFLVQYKSLRRLELTNCKLTSKSFDCTMLDGMTRLEYINLSNNPQIRSLCGSFFLLEQPTRAPLVVKLQNIGLTRLPKDMFWGQGSGPDVADSTSVNFRVIDLSDNKLTSLEAGLFLNQDFLEALDLSNNKLTAFEPTAFIGSKSSNTLITAAMTAAEDMAEKPSDSGLVALKYLNLAGNALTTLERATLAVAGGSNLKELSAANNQLKSLSPDTFQDVTQLQSLDLSNNKIKALHKDLFKNLSLLTTLVLNGNDIKVIPHGLLQTNFALRELGLAGFIGNELPSSVLSDGPKSLEVLDLGSKFATRSRAVLHRARSALAAELNLTIATVRSHTAEHIDRM